MKNLYMKKILVATFLILSAGFAKAQILSPVLWSYSAKKVADKTYEVHITATITGNWHLYAQGASDGPSTELKFTPNPLLTFDGKVKEVGKMKKAFDKNFNAELKYYEQTVDFVQKVKVKSAAATVVKGSVNYVVCNDSKCLPPKNVPFSINVGGK